MKTGKRIPLAVLVAMLAACGENNVADQQPEQEGDGGIVATDAIQTDEDDPDEGGAKKLDTSTYVEPAPGENGASCTMDYGFQYSISLEEAASLIPIPRLLWDSEWAGELPAIDLGEYESQISYPEEEPESFYKLLVTNKRTKAATSLTMPSYTDNLPMFDRAADWVTGEERCYQYSENGDVVNLSQEDAYDLYVSIAELTTGVTMNQTKGRRNVVGIRGAHPGQFFFNGDLPNRFNDTIVLLWIDEDGQKHVREFPVNTNTGVQKTRKSGQASALPANRHYRYVNGSHKGYNALQMNEYSYNTRDDSNNNGHIDNDRNGWLKPTDGTQDYDRSGSGHNIHYGKATNLQTSPVSNWSAGCQVIPGVKNWTTFITNAWTGSGKAVDYYLVDVRDIDKRVWSDCTADGSHDCPFPVEFIDGQFKASGVLDANGVSEWGAYNCAPKTGEGGPEHVYFFTWDGKGTEKKTVTINVSSPDGGDPDIHLLNADDVNACIARHDSTLSTAITPGRYYVIVDTYVSKGEVKYGSYDLSISLK